MEKSIKRYFPVFLLPTFLAFIIGFIVPFLMGIYLSFCDFRTVTDAVPNGLTNYIRAFQDAEFVHAFFFTAGFTIVTVVLINVLAFGVAIKRVGQAAHIKDQVRFPGQPVFKPE